VENPGQSTVNVNVHISVHLRKTVLYTDFPNVIGSMHRYGTVPYGTVKVGNFDHLMTFKIVLKIFLNSFLTIFLHENVRVLWCFWDPNTRFGSQKYHIFKKMLGGRSYP
jgi:hypothetical protein